MKLLIVTQVVDTEDSNLGFFVRWIEEFAKHVEHVEVICLKEGAHTFPSNVHVHSLGKEKGVRSRFVYAARFKLLAWKLRNEYDAVFVHMNPEYIVLCGLCWRLLGKRVAFWYTHKNIDLKLRIAELLAHTIFTASKESFRLASKKVLVVGHGIDVSLFLPHEPVSGSVYTVLSVGRFSPTKKQLDMVKAFAELIREGFQGRLVLVGGAITDADRAYERRVRTYIESHSLGEIVECTGSLSPEGARSWYGKSDLFINLSETGSLDKAVLEAMASGLQVLVSNEAFHDILPEKNFVFHKGEKETEEIAEKISLLSTQPADPSLRDYVVKNHDIVALLPKLVDMINRS